MKWRSQLIFYLVPTTKWTEHVCPFMVNYALIVDPVLYLFQSSGEACFASNPWVSSGLYCIVLHAKVFYVVLQVLGDVHEGPVFFWLAVTVLSATIGFRLWSCACAHLNTVLPPWHGKKSKKKKSIKHLIYICNCYPAVMTWNYFTASFDDLGIMKSNFSPFPLQLGTACLRLQKSHAGKESLSVINAHEFEAS